MAVMGNGDIVVGNKSPTRKPAPAMPTHSAERLAAPLLSASSDPAREERRCGAMSQQRTDSGAASTPQKFVRLVGCHDPKAGGR
jgi:hypothetical protein